MSVDCLCLQNNGVGMVSLRERGSGGVEGGGGGHLWHPWRTPGILA
jgi:hypothetical protein